MWRWTDKVINSQNIFFIWFPGCDLEILPFNLYEITCKSLSRYRNREKFFFSIYVRTTGAICGVSLTASFKTNKKNTKTHNKLLTKRSHSMWTSSWSQIFFFSALILRFEKLIIFLSFNSNSTIFFMKMYKLDSLLPNSRTDAHKLCVVILPFDINNCGPSPAPQSIRSPNKLNKSFSMKWVIPNK